ncbi:MAG TPA: phage minor head protein [Devosia sp.]|jgi:hypothetical protein|uniref:phage minor head protein n=1 Tax=Devosia sp. TaxID=1871048 RepID=UPI002F94A247
MDSRSGTSDLLATARQRSFETYLRFGRHPATGASAFNQKALEPLAPLPPEARRPTRFYVWRTADDARVRHSHAARDGKIFGWAEAPGGGHPGSEPNCRCWAEPYYGDPLIPDALVLSGPCSDASREWRFGERGEHPE